MSEWSELYRGYEAWWQEDLNHKEPFKQPQAKTSSFTQHTAAVCTFACLWNELIVFNRWLMDMKSQWCVSFPLKPTPLSRATGGGRQADWRLASPPHPKQQPTRHKGGGERQHQQYYDWLWWVSICSKKWWRDYRLLFLFTSADRGGSDWRKMRGTKKITEDKKRCSNKPT